MKEVEVIKASTGSVARRRSISGEGVKIERNRVAAYARVSTDEEEQLGSFQSQIQYYKDKIKQNKEWFFADLLIADGHICGFAKTGEGRAKEIVSLFYPLMFLYW